MTPTPTPNPKSALDILAAASDASGKANDGQLQHPALTANCGAPVDVSGIAATSALATNPLVQAAAGIILQQRQQQQQQQQQQDAVQQLAQLHYLQTMAANASGANQAVTSQVQAQVQRAAQTAVAQAMTGSAAVQSSNTNRRQVIPIAAAPPKNNMPVPIFKRSFSNLSGDSSAAPVNRAQSGKSSPVPPNFVSNSSSSVAASSTSGSSTSANEKKLQKRAANRRSAQLSRKRKKLFIEELREENDRLKRKEQILRAIPDLVVVFDSAGRLLFVSQAVRRVLDFAPTELEGSSFWDRLCEESVKLLKAAFMDALAARGSTDKKRRINAIENVEADGEDAAEVEAETVQLGSGMWELRLVDKNGAHRLVTLSGVVHFSGDSNNPECVCSIRPRETVQSSVRRVAADEGRTATESKRARNGHSSAASTADVVDPSSASSDDGASDGRSSTSSSDVPSQPKSVRATIKPQQSVVGNAKSGKGQAPAAAAANDKVAVSGVSRISDGDNDSFLSDSSGGRCGR